LDKFILRSCIFFYQKKYKPALIVIIVLVVVVLSSNFLFKKELLTLLPLSPEPNIILITIDGLRADHLGCYGYDRNISPNIDRFAQEGVLFENNFSQSPYSLSSHTSMLTSLYPLTHKVIQGQKKYSSAFDEDLTLSEVLDKRGFLTLNFSQGGYFTVNPLLDRGFVEYYKTREVEPFFKKIHLWLLQSADEKKFVFIYSSILNPPYSYQKDAENIYRDREFLLEEIGKAKKIVAKGINEKTFENLSDRDKSRILLYNLIEDYEQKKTVQKTLKEIIPDDWDDLADYSRQVGALVDSYDANIKVLDSYLGRLFDMLKASGAWDKALIIITSSHGQEFREHDGVGYSFNLYDTLLKTPLLIKLPKSQAVAVDRVSQFSESVDIMPTILDIFEIDYKGRMQGVSLLPIIKGNSQRHKKAVLGFYRDTRSVRTEYYKYITCNKRSCPRNELFDLLADPDEKNNLIDPDEPSLRGIDCSIYKLIRSRGWRKNK